MEQVPATPKKRLGRTILGTVPRITVGVAIVIAAMIASALPIYSDASFEKRQAERASIVAEMVAPDVAWREVDRLERFIDTMLNGQGLMLDAKGRSLAGNEALQNLSRVEVIHDGKLVGYLIAPKVVPFRAPLPAWLFLVCAILGVFFSAATARYLSSRISNSVKELSVYADSIGSAKEELDKPTDEFEELTTLRIAMENAADRTRKEANRLRGTAYTDPLTGLPNLNQLREIYLASKNEMTVQQPGAYAILDLDGFVAASQTFGIERSNQILEATANRIQSVLEDYKSDIPELFLASYHADRFCLFMPATPNGRDVIAKIVRRLNVTFSAPMSVGDQLVTLGMSAGITMLPEDGDTFEAVQRSAVRALQESRKKQPNSFQFYAPRFEQVARGRFRLESELREATKNSEFVPVFQPKIDLSNGRIVGCEALARWRRDGGRIVMPGTFIGVAEEMGLIEEIGRQILFESCRSAAKWRSMGFEVPVAVNVSPIQFEQDGFTELAQKALADSGLPPELLELEITESLAVNDPDKVIQVMEPLREMGVRLAIDDFGTGHSNLATLTKLPFDVFKIDRQFVSALETGGQAPAIVEMILAMSESLGLKTVAEGIETQQQAEFLRKRGCALAQGFLYSPGVPLEKFISLLMTWCGETDDLLFEQLG